jgi:Tetratricopeptide repeat
LHNLRRITYCLVLVLLAGSASAQEGHKKAPAEQRRLGSGLFREGLKKRGLTELLALHMKDYPPESPVAVLLMRREVKLSQSRDAAIDPNARKDALAEANEILRQVIEESPGDLRRFDWLLALGRSLLYEEAAPYSSAILYVGETASDRETLRRVTERAVKTIRNLGRQLAGEYARVDSMSAAEFEALEASGVLDTLDRVSPQADYLLIWGLFYDAVGREPDDAVRVSELNELLSTLTARPAILNTPQDQNPVQIPALLVAGMSQRRLNDHHRAREYFDRARAAYDRIANADEKERMRQLITLGEIESVQNNRDDGRFPAARASLDRLEKLIDEAPGHHSVDPFLLRTSHALLSRSLRLARAASAAHFGRTEESDVYRASAWKPLAALTLSVPDRRSELYATVYRQLAPDAKPEAMDPFERVALIVGLTVDENYDRAFEVADAFLDNAAPDEQILVPDVLYQVALGHYRQNDRAKAAAFFVRIAREYSAWPDALRAGELAVKLSYAEYQAASDATKAFAQATYQSAMRTLLDKFPKSSQAKYWRFFYAQALLDQGDADGGAASLAMVGAAHPFYLESLALRVRAIARQLETSRDSFDSSPTPVDLMHAYERLVAYGAEARGRGVDGAAARRLSGARATALVTMCEALILPSVGEYRRAVDLLAKFEDRFPNQEVLLARLWRVRLLAYESLGELEQVARSIPKYIASDRRGAGETLQALHDATIDEFRRLRELGHIAASHKKAMTALTLSQQLSAWAKNSDSSVSPAEKRLIALQLAEANLYAGDVNRANELFGILLPDGKAIASEMTNVEARTLLGKAEALRQRGECDRALVIFNRLATGLSPKLRLRWEALWGDLQCRTTLLEDPNGIVKVVEQQAFLYPEMGGPMLAKRFERLANRNRERASRAETP